MNFILKEEREILETVVALQVPFKIVQDDLNRSTITSYIFTQCNTRQTLTFVTIATKGCVYYDFDESVLDEVPVWRRSGTVSRSFSEYMEYKGIMANRNNNEN